MGKLPKFKSRTPSAKSRAARRAASPSTTIDKSVEAAIDSVDAADQDLSVLSARQGGGISKKKKQKPLSRQQRLRKERGIARADAVVEKLEVKVKRSKDKSRTIKNRSVAWEDLNPVVSDRKPAKKKSKSDNSNVNTDMTDIEMDNEDVPRHDTSLSETISPDKAGIHALNDGEEVLVDDIT